MSDKSKVLILGIGNSGRADDGLGWAFIDAIKDQLPPYCDAEYRYQLQVEDAELATHYDMVVFVDAHKGTFEKGFTWEECVPRANSNFTTHQLAPEEVLHLASSIYHKQPSSFILGIVGEKFCLELGLSEAARTNLDRSLRYFGEELKAWDNAASYR